MSTVNFGSEGSLGSATEKEKSSTGSSSRRDVASSENPNDQSTSDISSERSLVAGRFMNMLHAHDDARVMFLSAHQPRTR